MGTRLKSGGPEDRNTEKKVPFHPSDQLIIGHCSPKIGGFTAFFPTFLMLFVDGSGMFMRKNMKKHHFPNQIFQDFWVSHHFPIT